MDLLKIAIQKSGRLHDDSMKLLKEAGIKIDNAAGQLKARSYTFPAELLFLRNSDIPQYLADGVVDAAILGENVVVEKGEGVIITQRLGFSKCRLSLAIPKNEAYEGLSYFQNKRIATSYPNSLNAFLKENGIQSSLHNISGSVEIAPNIGLAEGICDLVSTGSTLFKNNLKEVHTILKSEACLVKAAKMGKAQQKLYEQLEFRIKAVRAAKNNKYVLLNAPNDKVKEIADILPGMKSPTIVPLAEDGWSSLHSVINENDFWDVIDQLKAAGAQGILIIPIEKMVL